MADTATEEQQAADREAQNRKDIAGTDAQVQHFDTAVIKLVYRPNPETGETETVEVMSDNLYPGERLKREVDAEKAKEATEAAPATTAPAKTTTTTATK